MIQSEQKNKILCKVIYEFNEHAKKNTCKNKTFFHVFVSSMFEEKI